ncbi:MAG TPA: hypothetical protein VIG50_20945 [Vicinamibacteria bacterium]
MIFGKRVSDYVRFQRGLLILTLVVGLLRLALSLGGVPNSTARFLSMTVVLLASALYYGVRVHTTGFGSYKHLLPLLEIQWALATVIVIVAILISAATGTENIYSAPEYGGTLSVPAHLGGHLVFGLVLAPLVSWGVASLVMLVTKKVTGARRVVAA